ncbi:MAG: YjjG family noncanonical pyrimidine nucleotidase [Muribaculaceae bacterium]|nr:YjjG family noncanonical pyrimidine nucleotidase [Muribaculaceae bacterium]MDE6462530.1 YjjG family noncanonical pyrimidine nucleotidase [Muribaculaceae bacterium]MDE6510444.1 YjjG family noncanonical pyrimidine nucleotidase [Muribaculaceae bacterium]
MKQLNDISWVWFDLDDTLWDFRSNSRELLGAIYHERGFDRWFATEQEWVDRYEEHNHRLWREFAAGNIDSAFLRADRFRHPLAEAGCRRADEEGEFLDGHYLDRLGRMSRLLPGAREILEELRSRSYKIGVLSNGFTQVQHCKLQTCGLDRLVDAVVLSDDAGVAKPDRRIFEYARRKAGVPAGSCLMVGDNPDTDIAGAMAAGWHAALFSPDGDKICPEGAFEVAELGQIGYILSD